ncbi:MAG: alpha/beta fold hydrolase [Ilumatobacteraceae bacterium]
MRIDGTIHGRDAQPSVVPIDAQRCLAVVDTPERPPELCTIDMVSGDVRALTHLNDDAVPGVDRMPHEAVTWRSDDLEIHGGLIRARDHGDGPLPLVVFVHGGPTWLWSTAYSPAESNQLALPVASMGAHVLLPNPRGSSGRGLDYADAVAGHVGDVDVRDLLAGVDDLVERGLVDPDRVAVVGTSYGGYMAAWLAARGDRFRCAAAFSLVADWNSFALTSAIGGGFERIYFPGADPATPAGRDELARRSPVHHVGPEAAPLLVLHGDADRITPIGQADAVRQAWRRAGRDVEVVVYPGEGHELVDPVHRRDAARRVLAFLGAHGILE